VAHRLHSAAIHLLRRLRKVDQVADIGPARLSALSVIVFGGAVTMGSLAEAEQVTAATMSRIVAGLESGRLATRRADPNDRRVTLIEATAKGRRLLEEGRERRVERLRSRLEKLNDEELALLAKASEMLERLAREMP
jgi:DNA-binding MarR family transcriptional regulator